MTTNRESVWLLIAVALLLMLAGVLAADAATPRKVCREAVAASCGIGAGTSSD